MVEEPPRPGPDGSATSCSSYCIISAMSFAALPSAPVTSAASWAKPATRTRWANHGAGGSTRSRRLAKVFITGSAFLPSADSEPDAPPNCRICVSTKLASRRRVARSMSDAQPATFWPKARGVAGCISVRPIIDVARCLRASLANPATMPCRPSISGGTASPSCNTIAVSSTSWLVAPQWT
jgi:hypothetical protein